MFRISRLCSGSEQLIVLLPGTRGCNLVDTLTGLSGSDTGSGTEYISGAASAGAGTVGAGADTAGAGAGGATTGAGTTGVGAGACSRTTGGTGAGCAGTERACH